MNLLAVFSVLSVTSILVLLTLGLAVIAGMMGIFNLAHGEFVLLGAVTVYLTVTAGAPVWLGIVLAPVVLAILGVIVERTLITHLYDRPLSAILATWALAIAIRGLVLRSLGGTARSVPYPVAGTIDIAGTAVSTWRLIILIVTIAVILVLFLVLRRTRVGLLIRAALENPELAMTSGIQTRRLYTAVFALGSALAGLAGAMVVPLSSLYVELGVTYLVRSFLALMVGGLGTIDGAALGAVLVGAIESSSSFFINPVFSGVLVFVLSILIMRFRPQGLLGRQ